MVLVLAGCKTPPQRDTLATTARGASPTEPAAPAQSVGASPVEFYLAQTEISADAMQIKLPDGVLYLQRQPVLTREDLTEAAALVDKQGQNFVGLRFSEAGTRKLNQISGQNIGKMLALVVERQLVAAPRISEPLNRGVLAFSVSSAQEANELASAIRGGDAPTPAASTMAPAPLAPAPAAPRR